MAEENTKAASGKIKEEEVKKVALTFDDGPNPDHTETLLEGLKERNVKATFFLLGAECEKYPEIVKKIHADGHLIGVHSYEHVNLSNLTDQAAVERHRGTKHMAQLQELKRIYVAECVIQRFDPPAPVC